jgi:hypothetical protein
MKNVYERLIGVMADLEAIQKTKVNPAQGYAYRGIDDMYNELHKLFVKHGIMTVPEVEAVETVSNETARGDRKLMTIHRLVRVKYKIMAEDGQYIETVVYGEGNDTSDKALYKALSGAHKYLMIQLFAIPTEDVVEPEQETIEVEKNNIPKPETKSGDLPQENIPAFGELLTKMANAKDKEELKKYYVEAIKYYRDKEHLNKVIEVRELRLKQLEEKGKKEEKKEEKAEQKPVAREDKDEGIIF